MRALSSLLTCSGLMGLVLASGCAALHPIRGIPADQLALDMGTESRSAKSTIDLSLLVQTKPDQYRVGPKDVLSVYVPGVLGRIVERDDEVGQVPPINQPQSLNDIPTVGFPLTVRDNGTLPLPQVQPIYVQGMTLGEVEQAIFRAYTEQSSVLNASRTQILVSLARPREYEVLVVRQEKSNDVAASAPNIVNVGRSRRGTARLVKLPAYNNDVLHALAKERDVDGLPGLDAENTIYIIRRRQAGDAWPAAMCQDEACGCGEEFCGDGCAPDPYMTGDPMTTDPYAHGGPVMPAPYSDSPQYYTPPSAPYVPQMAPSDSFQPTPYHMQGGMSQPTLAPEPSMGPAAYQQPLPPNAIPAGYSPMQFQEPTRTQPASLIRGQSPFYSHRSPSVPMPGHGEITMPGHGSFDDPTSDLAELGDGSATMNDPAMPAEDWSWQQALADFDPTVENPHVIKIPVRLSPGEKPCFDEQDIILEDGDIVFIESRDTEVFYTAGLLGGGQWELPRDYDLNLLEAIAISQGPQNIQAVGTSNGQTAFNSDVTSSGSSVVILRTLPGGGRISIETNIYDAIRHPDEHNVRILPGDMIFSQYTKGEAVLAFFDRNVLQTALFGFATGFVAADDN